MTREEYDKLPSNGQYPCPDCGKRTTHPALSPGGCQCPDNERGTGTKHINLFHHTCNLFDQSGGGIMNITNIEKAIDIEIAYVDPWNNDNIRCYDAKMGYGQWVELTPDEYDLYLKVSRLTKEEMKERLYRELKIKEPND